jgi:hypothetical protein
LAQSSHCRVSHNVENGAKSRVAKRPKVALFEAIFRVYDPLVFRWYNKIKTAEKAELYENMKTGDDSPVL